MSQRHQFGGSVALAEGLTDLGGPAGIYNVTATGNMGTTVRAAFVVVASTTGNT